MNGKYTEGLPQASCWTIGRRLLSLGDYRSTLDELTIDRVHWMSYKEHYNVRPFEMLSLFFEYIRLGLDMHLHLFERILRQFGYTQTIPQHLSVFTTVQTGY